jgi:hypothetical protein
MRPFIGSQDCAQQGDRQMSDPPNGGTSVAAYPAHERAGPEAYADVGRSSAASFAAFSANLRPSCVRA